MPRFLVGRGTLLNTATVAAGALVGLAIGKGVPQEYQAVAMTAIGLFTCGLGLKLFLETKNALIVAGSLILGGILGVAMRIQPGLEAFAGWAEMAFSDGGAGRFQEAVITTSVLFCVGPMTLMGCLQEAVEDRFDLLAIKSTMDGVGAVFFAATLGPGVLVTAGVVLVVQGGLTLSGSPLRRIAQNARLIAEANAAGGMLLLSIGLGLLDLVRLPTASLLPALFVAPAIVAMGDRLSQRGAAEGRHRGEPPL